MVAFETLKKPSVKTDEILKSTASSVTVSGEVLQENGATRDRGRVFVGARNQPLL